MTSLLPRHLPFSSRHILAVACALLISGMLVHSAHADGLSVFPVSLEFPDTFRGGEYVSTVGVLNNSDAESTFVFEKDGNAAQWITITDAADRTTEVTELVVGPRGRGQVVAKLAVPRDTANGSYRGTLTVLRHQATAGDPAKGSAVSIGAQLPITVRVTGTQKLEGSVADVSLSEVEVALPLETVVAIQNSGNVVVVPEISVSVSTPGGPSASQTFAEETIYPGETKRVPTRLDTSKLTPGDYTARVQVMFGTKDLGTTEKRFTLHPRGTLTRRGVLDSLTLTNPPEAGGTAKIVARIRNTGQIDSKALFIGELYRGSTLVKAISGIERSIARGDETTLDVFVDIPSNGAYRLTGKVSFEGNESEPKELTFQVGAGLPMYLIGGGALALVVLAGGAAFIVRSRRATMSMTQRTRSRVHGPMI